MAKFTPKSEVILKEKKVTVAFGVVKSFEIKLRAYAKKHKISVARLIIQCIEHCIGDDM